jgi:hypothetical protein
MEILNLVSRIHLASFVIILLPKPFKYFALFIAIYICVAREPAINNGCNHMLKKLDACAIVMKLITLQCLDSRVTSLRFSSQQFLVCHTFQAPVYFYFYPAWTNEYLNLFRLSATLIFSTQVSSVTSSSAFFAVRKRMTFKVNLFLLFKP